MTKYKNKNKNKNKNKSCQTQNHVQMRTYPQAISLHGTIPIISKSVSSESVLLASFRISELDIEIFKKSLFSFFSFFLLSLSAESIGKVSTNNGAQTGFIDPKPVACGTPHAYRRPFEVRASEWDPIIPEIIKLKLWKLIIKLI